MKFLREMLFLAVLLTLVTIAIWPDATSQPATHDRNNPRWKTVTADTGFWMKGIKLPGGWYIDSASIAGLIAGQTLVADTSGGRKRLIAGAGGAGAISITGGPDFPGIDDLKFDTAFGFALSQTLSGQAIVRMTQALGPWASPSHYRLSIQPGGDFRMYGPNGLKYTTFTAQNSAGNFIGVPIGNGTMVISAVSPFTIDPVTGQLGFAGAWTVPQGGTNATVAPSTGAVIWYNGSAYAGVTGTNNYFLRFGGSSTPTAFNLFGTANTWGARQTVQGGAVVADSFKSTNPAIDSTYVLRGNGVWTREYTFKATFGSNDSIIVTGLGIDSNFVAHADIIGTPPEPFTHGTRCDNAGRVIVSTLNSGVAGLRMAVTVKKTNR